jgi:hypothetical protein
LTARHHLARSCFGQEIYEGKLDGLYLDIIPAGTTLPTESPEPATTLETHVWDPPSHISISTESHREFVIFFHDEPEFIPPHGEMFEDPCLASHGGAHDVLPIMPNLISRRANGKQGAKCCSG